MDELSATRTDRGVTITTADRRIAIDLAEHLLAALGGLGVRSGVRIETDSDELPLLDGGAHLFCEALFAIHATCAETGPLRVAARATLRRGESVYQLAPLDDGAAGARVAVDVSFPAPVGRERAAWDGDPADFFARIARARTFGWAHEHAALLASSRARAVDLGSVIVFEPDGVMNGCRPNEPGEIARHKLLDLVGDLALYGGPPRGSIEAAAPGHTATHAIVAEALASGVLVREEVAE
jgi:UDP-3-O-[3-hydroxymyristoyl] N-acetylglucosamine deacetylase